MKKQNGITIIETMVSLAILSTGLIGALSMQLHMSHADQLSRQRGVAVILAQAKIEEFRSGTALIDGNDTCKNSNTAPACVLVQSSADYTRTWSVIQFANSVAGTPAQINITVTWNDLNNDQKSVKNFKNTDTGQANKVEFNTAI